MVLGPELKTEEAASKVLKHNLVIPDLENAHNPTNRQGGQEAREIHRGRPIASPASPQSPRGQQPVQPDIRALGVIGKRPAVPM